MNYWVFGRDAQTKEPRDPLHLDADSEACARTMAEQLGMQVEFVNEEFEPPPIRQHGQPVLGPTARPTVVRGYQCPRCGYPVQRRSKPVAPMAGIFPGTVARLLGASWGAAAAITCAGVAFGVLCALLHSASGGFRCLECGLIPQGEFPPKIQEKMKMDSVILILIGIVVVIVAIPLTGFLASMSMNAK